MGTSNKCAQGFWNILVFCMRKPVTFTCIIMIAVKQSRAALASAAYDGVFFIFVLLSRESDGGAIVYLGRIQTRVEVAFVPMFSGWLIALANASLMNLSVL